MVNKRTRKGDMRTGTVCTGPKVIVVTFFVGLGQEYIDFQVQFYYLKDF